MRGETIAGVFAPARSVLQTIHGDDCKRSALAELEAQREQDLAEARAIQVGMLPHRTLQTLDLSVCCEFQPFHEVDGDFLDFFTLTDGTIGIYLGDGIAGGAIRGLAVSRYSCGRAQQDDRTAAILRYLPKGNAGRSSAWETPRGIQIDTQRELQ